MAVVTTGLCSPGYCSKHAIDFLICICKFIPLTLVSKDRVARECLFVTQDYKDMINKNKRFLL